VKTKTLVLAAGFLAAFSVAGCQKTAEGVASDTERNTEKVAAETREAGREVAEETREAGQEVKEATREAGQEVKEEAREAGQAVGQATENAQEATQDALKVPVWTAKVKSALIADPKISAYNLNVDTDAETNSVRIRGTVPSQAEKDRITQVAKKALGTAANVKIDNQVQVGRA